MMYLIPRERFYKFNWVEYHRNHCFMIKDSKPNTLLPGNSIVAGIIRYSNVSNDYLPPVILNLGIGRDCVENNLCRAINLSLPPSVKNMVILCGTNRPFS